MPSSKEEVSKGNCNLTPMENMILEQNSSRVTMDSQTDNRDDEAMMAVFNLCYMRHAFDHHEKKQKALETEEHEDAIIVAQQEGLYYGNYAPFNLPPIPSLHSLIQICSKPYEKKLTSSDVRDDLARLAMSKEHVKNHLIPLLNENEDLDKGIKVTTYDLAGKQYPMLFKIWAAKIHVLTGGWKDFCHEHNLVEKQDIVRVWMFRNVATGKLCFVIDRV